FRRPGAGGRHAVHGSARGRPVEVRLVAVRRHALPLADRLDLGERRAGLGRQRAGRPGARTAPGVRAMTGRPRPPAGGRVAVALRGKRAALGGPWRGAGVAVVPALVALSGTGLPSPAAADGKAASPATPVDDRVVFPASVQQGAMVLGKVPPGSIMTHANHTLRTTSYGTVVFGVGRDAVGPL